MRSSLLGGLSDRCYHFNADKTLIGAMFLKMNLFRHHLKWELERTFEVASSLGQDCVMLSYDAHGMCHLRFSLEES